MQKAIGNADLFICNRFFDSPRRAGHTPNGVRGSRFILLFLLLYQAMFLNIILPGHTRGEITTDGKHAPDSGNCPCCCCGEKAVASKGPVVPSQRDRDHCVLCQFMAGLTSVPLIRLTLPEMGLAELRPVPPQPEIVSLQLIPTYLACGPPDE